MAKATRSAGVVVLPAASRTAAAGTSPRRSSGRPTTAASTTDGCSSSAASTSTAYTEYPPRLITCLERPEKRTVPSGPRRARSPVRSHPSSVSTASVADTSPQ